MNASMPRRIVSAVLLVFLLAGFLPASLGGPLPAQAEGTVSLTAFGDTYTENFDTLASSGTTNTAVPNGWAFAESGSNANTTYRADTGSGNTGDTYSFGASGSSERAFGGLRSGSLVPTIGAQFTNNTGGTIMSLDIAYTGEQWRAGVASRGAADKLDFQLSTDATSLTTGTWAHHDGLDFSSPNISAAAGLLDGNVAPNRTALVFTITGLSIPNGASFWIRWTDFDISSSDDGLAVDDFSLTPQGIMGPVDPAPSVTATTPANNAGNVLVGDSLTVIFSEPVNVADTSFTLVCSYSNAKSATISGGPETFTLDPQTDFAYGESCTLTVVGANVSDLDTDDPYDNMTSDHVINFVIEPGTCANSFTPVYAVQGSGAAAAITGPVVTQGVVVADYEYPGSGTTSNFLRGYYLQDLNGDNNPATSDGIFVFNGNFNQVNLGDVVRVRGIAGEFQGQTQINANAAPSNCGTGSVAPVDVTFPVPSPTFLEQYEGMLVRLPQTMFVTEHFQLGRFGQVVLSSGGRLKQPTNVVAPGAPAQALQAANNLNKIILDDASQAQNPDPIVFARDGLPLSASNTLRGGDTATGIVGVLTYTWAGNAASGNAYRVRPINALGGTVNFEPANPRPAGPPEVGGTLKVASMNLLNYFNTFDGCTLGVNGEPDDCRGAENAFEFERQWQKTVAAILKLNPDVIGVNEIENDGYGPNSAIADLVNRLNAATAPGTYAFIDADAGTGQVNALGTDAIKVGMIYKPAAVTPVGQTAALNTVEFVKGGDDEPRNRPALAQAFQQNSPNGARFIAVVNHLKSKGSACDVLDAGDGQGNCNLVRVNAANRLLEWLAANPTGTGDSDVLLIGDYNSYAMEDPITVFKAAGYTDLIAQFVGPDAYSYVFDGQWGYLDHALGSASIVPQVTGTADYHINADEPSVLDYNTNFKSAGQVAGLFAPDEFRNSDHDIAVVGLALNAPPVVGPITAPLTPVTVNTSFLVSASFTDQDVLDTHTAEWDWGDGTTSAVAVSESGGSDTVTGEHAYTAPGIYTIVLTVTDFDGASGTSTFQYVVAVDPNGGSVTGGGWIQSPAGAFVRNPAVVGKGHFNLNVQYRKNAALPQGNVQFKLQEAGLDFRSTGIDWLVVNGSQAFVQGTGTVNGGGSFAFLASAVDGADAFRIKIWEAASGAVVYDSQPGAPIDAAAATLLGGGNVTVHGANGSAADAGEEAIGAEGGVRGADGQLLNPLYLPLVGK